MGGSGGVAVFMGGVGLFLLGMMLMTDGLKLAAGPALGRILSSSTQTRLRGLGSGILVTALVQSSSAVTVAAIGFVNAGLLSFSQSLWVLFGANVGTTMTGWLVALIGLKIKIEAAALPMIGLGMALRLTGAQSRRGAVGGVLTGFGVLFLGIGFLQQAFAGAGSEFDLGALGGQGLRSILYFVLAGTLLTVLMQSSSAALAVVLTLAESGVLPLQEAAAAVIGANIGTTVTAVLAAIGATSNARRAAAAHVLFNVVTGLAALVLLPIMLALVEQLRSAFHMASAPAVSLALFHTVFNLLGVALMWPLADRLASFLTRRFAGRGAEAVKPRYLDDNVATVPALAISALDRELRRLGGLAIDQLRAQLRQPGNGTEAAAAIASLGDAIDAFEAKLSRETMSENSAEVLATLLRVQHYYENCGEMVPEISAALAGNEQLHAAPLREAMARLGEEALRVLAQLDPENADFGPMHSAQRSDFEALYQAVKSTALREGASGRLPIVRMEVVLRGLSAIHRAVDQAGKAATLLATLTPPGSEATAEAQGEALAG